ncbi:Nif3-like dinuclear metal center hexameric protein [Alicyclobacillus sendaiensis]|uniref:Nif3-like dinuclear metal center hexameric protein n=1 Tax=Alicyclobacillus sendaiensis TaxID=192387 RepID=UPI000783D2BE|nr:Nif3-like dinuclear metal center hexameric protein [Alicyclobacillus sendaiensis]
MRVRDVIAALESMMPCDERGISVDGLVCGDAEAPVRAVGVTFVASLAVLNAARAQGIDLVLSHEGALFRHQGEVEGDPVATAKARRMQDLGVAVYRLHDRPHRTAPDWIAEGLAEALGFAPHVRERLATPCDVPVAVWPEGRPLDDLVRDVCARLKLPRVRLSGRADLVRRAALLPGYRGTGDLVARVFRETGADLLLAGEGPEWEAMEYARDAAAMGLSRAVLWLGHQASESPGMRRIAEALRGRCSIPVFWLEQPEAYTWLEGGDG